ncbi:nicotinate-nucleotide adenylyltransferase [Shewanella sp. HL-SH5]|uniref:nicotinate-nucleotide adenylyltransferase n=1 Tax=Shewanella sp. HL-SH5 TaxID=3436241 RepID=UPI003EBD2925
MRIGILGGTFDPIHLGHIRPALEVKQQLHLDKVWLMPNHIPPHKQSTNVSSKHRLAMVEDVCQQFSDLEVCDIEINRDSPSYTVVSLQNLQHTYPQHQFYFIMGMDSFLHLPSWHLWQTLFNHCHIVLCQRPGWQLDTCNSMQQVLDSKSINHVDYVQQLTSHQTPPTHGAVIPVAIALQNISSTDVRHKLHNNQPVNELIMPSTLSYIQQHKLYLC